MIELAPRHKYGLSIASPVMPAAGAFGYGDAYQDLVEYDGLGAIVTNPVSMRPRHAASGQRMAVYGQHFVVHTGWPNPGLRRLVRQVGPLWARLPVPVIVHLLATRPGETGQAAARLSGIQGVRGIELGFREETAADVACEFLAAAAEEGDLPVIAKIPFGREADLIPALVAAGVDAVTLSSPPRAVLPLAVESAEDGIARFIRGRLYGRALFPMLLFTLSRWIRETPVPVIACGGISSGADALTCLTLGAAAVQVDALLWRDPTLLTEISKTCLAPQPAVEASVDGGAPSMSRREAEDMGTELIDGWLPHDATVDGEER